MRSTKSPSSTSAGRRGGAPGGRSLWKSLLGLDPVPAPPHVFTVGPGRLRYGQFVRERGGYRFRSWREIGLPPDTFHAGLLGGPLRDPAAFQARVGDVVQGIQGGVREASLVVPDAWLRVTFTDVTEVPKQAEARDEVLRWKLRRLVPFRVDELRVGAVEVAPLPVQEEPRRLMLGFGIEQLLAQLEDAFAAHGVRIGRITNGSLALLSALAVSRDGDPGGFSALVLVEEEGYALIFVRGGEPVLHRYKAFGGTLPESAQTGFVTRDLKLTRNFLDENFPGSPLGSVLLVAPPEIEALWVDRLQEGLGRPAAPLDGRHLPPLRSEEPVAPVWRELAPMFGAARQEVT